MISSMPTAKLIAAGRYYFNLGFEAFPARIYFQNKNGQSKKKLIRPVKWKSESVTLDRFNQLVSSGSYNTICIKAGSSSNLFVFDLDIHDCKTAKYFFRKRHIKIPWDTPVVKTQGGGFHLWFTFPEMLNSYSTGSDKNVKVDWRGEGGLIFAPPTSLSADRIYIWITKINSDKSNLRNPPGKLIEWILSHKSCELTSNINQEQKAINKGRFTNIEPNFEDSYGNKRINELTPKQREWHNSELKKLVQDNSDRSKADINYMIVANRLGLSKKQVYILVKDKSKFATRQYEYFERTYNKAVSICKGN